MPMVKIDIEYVQVKGPALNPHHPFHHDSESLSVHFIVAYINAKEPFHILASGTSKRTAIPSA